MSNLAVYIDIYIYLQHMLNEWLILLSFIAGQCNCQSISLRTLLCVESSHMEVFSPAQVSVLIVLVVSLPAWGAFWTGEISCGLELHSHNGSVWPGPSPSTSSFTHKVKSGRMPSSCLKIKGSGRLLGFCISVGPVPYPSLFTPMKVDVVSS